jgi:hypothetical protein
MRDLAGGAAITTDCLRRLPASLAIALAFLVAPGQAQETGELSAWQAEKCQIYQQGWEEALETFGSDNLNYNFFAQNENFIASGCVAVPDVCPQSSQEFEIANALTIRMMNAGAASTFLPFRCQVEAAPSMVDTTTGIALDSRLCRSQLDLLVGGNKLTAEEAAVHEAQCDCLEQREQDGGETNCAQ